METLTVNRVVQNGPATIVWFADGTKSVTRCQPYDTYDPVLGVAWALCKRLAKENGTSVRNYITSFMDMGQLTEPNVDMTNEAAKLIAAYECDGADVMASMVPVAEQPEKQHKHTTADDINALWPKDAFEGDNYQCVENGRRKPSRYAKLVEEFALSDLASTQHKYPTAHKDYVVGRSAVRNVQAGLSGYIKYHGYSEFLAAVAIGDIVFLRKKRLS